MPLSLSMIEQEAALLPPLERARLAEKLLESLQIPCVEEVEAAWATEIVTRVQAYENGQTAVFDALSVFREARA